jgi:hypothetical protein
VVDVAVAVGAVTQPKEQTRHLEKAYSRGVAYDGTSPPGQL